MNIQIRFEAHTLGDAKLAEEIIESVRETVTKHKGTLHATEHEHTLSAIPGTKEPWFDHGLVVKATGAIVVSGAPIPLIKQVQVGD